MDKVPITLPLEEQATLSILLAQPHRHYHNIEHVNDCLVELYNYPRALDIELTYAIWYHDIIYNPYAPPGFNEAQSASLFRSEYDRQNSGADNWVERTSTIIELTAHHLETQDIPSNCMAAIMLDIDLAGLGKPLHIFARNSFKIRHEYYNTLDMDVVRGRLKFFQMLNQRKTFYYTEYFKDLYHTQSKKNLAQEISILEESIENGNAGFYMHHLMREMNTERL